MYSWKFSQSIQVSKYWNVIVNFRRLPLCDTLCYPNDVPVFLFTQFDVGVEDTKVKLLHERQLVNLHLCSKMYKVNAWHWIDSVVSYFFLKKAVFKSFLTRVGTSPRKYGCIFLHNKFNIEKKKLNSPYRITVSYSLYFVIIRTLGKP